MEKWKSVTPNPHQHFWTRWRTASLTMSNLHCPVKGIPAYINPSSSRTLHPSYTSSTSAPTTSTIYLQHLSCLSKAIAIHHEVPWAAHLPWLGWIYFYIYQNKWAHQNSLLALREDEVDFAGTVESIDSGLLTTSSYHCHQRRSTWSKLDQWDATCLP